MMNFAKIRKELKEIGEAFDKSKGISQMLQDMLDTMPAEIIRGHHATKLEVGVLKLSRVYGDERRAARIVEAIVQDAVGQWFPDVYIDKELDFEVAFGCAGGRFRVDQIDLAEWTTNPSRWRKRMNRQRD